MSWDLIEKSGNPTNGGWDLNENNMTLNQDIDLDTGLSVLLNSLGTGAYSWTNQTKN